MRLQVLGILSTLSLAGCADPDVEFTPIAQKSSVPHARGSDAAVGAAHPSRSAATKNSFPISRASDAANVPHYDKLIADRPTANGAQIYRDNTTGELPEWATGSQSDSHGIGGSISW
ncbi:hypothetical protein [Nitratireductor basaltis]|uniref:Lipoprotein n=1 Tax=Nitratireductor basaltis TaxID=472175 RepID=A0A084UDT5_9HYPH|nr:hypothetical protein [Nitratireductor basaltis]KFB11121.1 hypothetical protein EL18_02165 [Nitratireductor basaltis]